MRLFNETQCGVRHEQACGAAASSGPSSPPLTLVPQPAACARRLCAGAGRWLIGGLLALALIAAIGIAWWLSSTGGNRPLHHRAGHARRRDARRGGHRHGQSGAHDHRRQLCLRHHPRSLCDFNTRVKQGQVCAKIDPRPYQTVVDQNKANLVVAQAQLEKDKANLAYAQVNYDRNARLAQTNAVSKDALDNAKSALDQAQAQIGVDQATIAQRQAQLEAAKINLGYTNIVSPVNGTVVSRNVTIGQTVAASFQTPTLFLIATDLTKMQVDTNVSESDIGGIKEGDKAYFTVDAFPEPHFQGTVSASPAIAADLPKRRDLRRRGQRRQCRSRAQAGHDGGEPHRHRRAQRRAAGAEPGAALRAGRRAGARRRQRATSPAQSPAVEQAKARSGCCATACRCGCRSPSGSTTTPTPRSSSRRSEGGRSGHHQRAARHQQGGRRPRSPRL